MAQVLNNTIIINEVSSADVQEDYGMIWNGKCRIRYFDIDGTLLKLEYVSRGEYTSPPVHPNYDPEYLVFAEWNYDTTADPVQQPLDIGAIYNNKDNASYIFMRLFWTNQTIDLSYLYNYTYVDWGDGTVDDLSTHTYTNNPNTDVVIKIYGDFSSNEYRPPIGTNHNLEATFCAITKLYLNVSNFGAMFLECSYLRLISLTPQTQKLNWLRGQIRHINLPKNIQITTFMGTEIHGTIDSLYGLQHISIPPSAQINSWQIQNTSLTEGIWSASKLPQHNYSYCRAMHTLYIKSSTIYELPIANTYISDYIIDTDTIPQLQTYNYDFQSTYNNIYWVRDELVDQFKNATNWSMLADQIKPLSQHN